VHKYSLCIYHPARCTRIVVPHDRNSAKDNFTPHAVIQKLLQNESITERRADRDTLVRTQMVEQIAQKDTGHICNRAPTIGTIVPGARSPAVRSINVNLSADVAITHPAPGHDGDRVRIVVYPLEVSVHLGVKETRPRRISDPRRSVSNAFDGDRTREIQPEIDRIKLCDGASKRMSNGHYGRSTLLADQILDFSQDAGGGSTVCISESVMDHDVARYSGE